MDLSRFGSKIKEERKRQGMTLEMLSEKVGISRNFLWEIESGRKAPALNTLYQLSITLNISIDYLFGITEERKYLSFPKNETKRKEEMSKILDLLNQFDIQELSFAFNLISSFEKYLKMR